MEFLLYGFEADIRKYEMREIFFWLLMIALLHLIVGNFVAKRRIHKEYMRIIRYGRFSKWWHGLCIRVIGICFVSTVAVFAISVGFQTLKWGRTVQEVMGITAFQAFGLFLLNVCFLSVIQVLLVNLGQWEKLSFLIVTVIEVVSLYGRSILKEAACWLPGSWKMYKRSSLALPEGYNGVVIVAIQIVFIVACICIGYKLSDRRK